MPAPFSSPFVTIGGRRTCPCSSMVCCRHPTLRQFFPLLSPAPTFPSSLFVPPAGDFLPIAAERFTVVSTGFQPRCGMKTGTLPRNRLAASATGGASAVSARDQWSLDFLYLQEPCLLWDVVGIDSATDPLPLPFRRRGRVRLPAWGYGFLRPVCA